MLFSFSCLFLSSIDVSISRKKFNLLFHLLCILQFIGELYKSYTQFDQTSISNTNICMKRRYKMTHTKHILDPAANSHAHAHTQITHTAHTKKPTHMMIISEATYNQSALEEVMGGWCAGSGTLHTWSCEHTTQGQTIKTILFRIQINYFSHLR